MDELDLNIIAELLKNAELSNSDLACKFEISEKTVRRRIQHLIDSGAIKRAVISDPVKLGYNVRTFVSLEVEHGSVNKVAQELSSCPKVDFIAVCTGQVDILFGAWFKSSDEMLDFVVTYLHEIPGIRKSQTSVAMEVKSHQILPK